MIQELNKMPIVHLYMLGFHEELSNFKLSLNNPSTQGEMLKVEQWKEKVLLYKDLVYYRWYTPTSHTWRFKKNIFNWSEDEIKLDLEQQRLEKAEKAELEKTPEVITKTGYFDKVDKLYGDIMTQKMGDTESEDFGGGFGDEDTGGGFGGDTGGFGGDTGGFGDEDAGGFGGDEAGGGEFGEGFRGDEDVIDKLLLEGKKKNEDIIMMTSGIDELLNEENFGEKDILT